MTRFAGLRWRVLSLAVMIAASAQVQAAVGRTEGSAGVAATGSARYTVPLPLPPGTNGLTPELAIAYDSRHGNGLLGVGFRLAGLSSIQRCNSTLAQDGRVAAPAYDANDRFCLDGQRLRLTSGVYGAAGSQYQTEVESFARVTALGTAGSGPASFRVERRDGLIYEYGATTDSRVTAPFAGSPREWALSQVRDRNGNYLAIVYTKDEANGSHRPSMMSYAGNLLTGAAPAYLVQFVYESRPSHDVPYRFHASGVVADLVRLDRIDVHHASSARLVRSFDLANDNIGGTGLSRLASLQECAGQDCLAPTQFAWSSPPAGWSGIATLPLPAALVATSIPGDIDGDGHDDLAYQDPTSRRWRVLRGSANGLESVAVDTGLGTDGDASQAIAVDLDGDGRREVLMPGSGGYLHRLHRAPQGGYVYASTGLVNPAPPGGLIAGDIDGDGREDLVYVKPGVHSIFWRRSLTATTPSFAAEAVLWTAPSGTQLPGAPFAESQQRFRSIARSGDFNGDGRTDLVLRIQQSVACGKKCTQWVSRWQVLASNGAALAPQYLMDGNTEVLLGDFNGDGLTDIGYWNSFGQWELLLGAGTRAGKLAVFAGSFPTSAYLMAAGGSAMVADWDADGRADLLQPASDGRLLYCRGVGTSLEGCQPTGMIVGTLSGSPLTLDANGDGHADLLVPTSDTRLYLHQTAPPDLLVAITDGLGLRTEFAYAPLSSVAVHRAGSSASFPVRDVARGGHVVARMLAGNGTRHQDYFYEGARVHVQGRGFLGFARRTITPGDTGPVRVEEYLQDPARPEAIGLPSRITLQQRSGVPVQRTSFAWTRHGYGSGVETRYFGYPSTTTVEQYELDGVRYASTVTSSVFDTFGTLVQQQVTTTEHAKGLSPGAQHISTTALSGVVNDTANWCLGRPASTQLTRSHGLPGGAAVTRSVAHAWDFAKCRATQEVVEPASATLRVTTQLAYDSYGNVTTETVTPVGQPSRTTTLAWSEGGRFVTTRTNPEGHVERLAWDSASAVPVSTTDANGLVTLLQHDGFGRLQRRTRPDGTSTVVSLAACGSGCPWPAAAYVVSTAERGVGEVPLVASEAGFDREDREVYRRHELPGGAQALQVLRYDPRGRLSQQSFAAPCCAAPTRWVTHVYDVLGRRVLTERPTSQAVPTPVVTRWRYDGLAVTETDALGRATTRRFDTGGRVVQVIDPALADTDYEYDAFGQLVRTRDVTGAETTMTYDVRGFRRSLTDPSAGHSTFDYLPLGELRSQANARGQVTSYTYDRLSRPLTRTEPEGTTTWTWGASAAARNVGSLAAISAPGFQESYQYDDYGRPSVVSRSIAGRTLVSRMNFDPTSGLADTFTYPATVGAAPLRVRNHYERGRLVRVSDVDSGTTYWQLDTVDSSGQVAAETLGNGVRVASTFDAVTGWMLGRTAGPGGGSAYQNLAYGWDSVGNLVSREERNHGVLEQYYYDNRDRLDYVMRGGSMALDLAYDDIGNLTYKSDVGTYRYDTSRRQAAVAAGSNTYTYDANGAVTSASGTTIGWRSYDLPSQITHPAGNYSAFEYGPDRSRYRQVARAGGVLTETLYAAGGMYERETSAGVTRERHYIVADGRRVAVQTRQSGTAPTTVYLLEDHLGGVDGFTSASGQLLARASYQPFGARRAGNGLGGAPTSGEWQHIQATTPRGYTGHEHLDNLGLVHMNGRVYDPVLGRFLSPDPVVQAPYDTQGLNRYAYVRNNPLRYNDPSGFCFNTHPAADQQAAQCVQNIVISGSVGISDWQTYRFTDFAAQAEMFARMLGAAANATSATGGETPEEFVIEGRRPPPIAPSSLDATMYAPMPSWGGIPTAELGLRPIDYLALLLGGVLALIEPTPSGEAVMASALVGYFGRRAATSVSYSPVNPGPLSAGIANTFRGASYREVTYAQPTSLYRVYGGTSGQLGSFWTTTSPTGALRSRIDLGLNPLWGNTATQVVRIEVPAGVRMYEGFAASQGSLVGGGTQVYIPQVNPAWIVR